MGLGGNAGGGAQISGLGHWALAIGHRAQSNTIQSFIAPTSSKSRGSAYYIFLGVFTLLLPSRTIPIV